MNADIDIRDRVTDSLSAHPGLASDTLRVDVVSGYVTLAGQLISSDQREAAVRIAGEVEGVRGVSSEITLLPMSVGIIPGN